MTGSKPLFVPPEVSAILKKFRTLLENESAQNEAMAQPFRNDVMNGIDCDELPFTDGPFGRSPLNPIPVNGVIGEVIYLSMLRTSTGCPVMFHRLGSENSIDIYDVLATDQSVREHLYLSMYHPRKSRKAPERYTLANKLDLDNYTYGVSSFVPDFPAKLDAHIRKWQINSLGLPCPVHRVREVINGARYAISPLEEDEI
jgi:hypothetical protein